MLQKCEDPIAEEFLNETAVKESETLFVAAFGRRLRALRKKAGLSHKQLGLKVGLSFQSIWKYEAGLTAVSFKRLPTLAAGLGLSSVSELFEGGDTDAARLRLIEQDPEISPELKDKVRALVRMLVS